MYSHVRVRSLPVSRSLALSSSREPRPSMAPTKHVRCSSRGINRP